MAWETDVKTRRLRREWGLDWLGDGGGEGKGWKAKQGIEVEKGGFVLFYFFGWLLFGNNASNQQTGDDFFFKNLYLGFCNFPERGGRRERRFYSLARSVSLQTAWTQGPYTLRNPGLLQAHSTSWGSQPLTKRAVDVQLFLKVRGD